MIKRNYLLLLILIFNTLNIACQENITSSDILIGKWNAYKTTTLEGGDGSEITADGKPFNKKVMMNFLDSKTMLFSINGSEEYKIDYSIKNDKLIISHRKYTIKSLTRDALVLKEEKLLGNILYLKKETN